MNNTMHKPFDITLKTLMDYDPPAWLKFFGIDPDGPVSAVKTEVSTVKSDVDKVFKIGGRSPWMIHIEFQSTPGKNTIRRMFRSNVLIADVGKLPVLSVLALLRPSADSRKFNGRYVRRVKTFGLVTLFRYAVVRFWELDVEAILNGPPAVLPIATLAKVSDEAVPSVLRRIDDRMIHETDSSTASTIMVASLLLAGLRIERGQIVDLMRRLSSMNLLQESSFYQLLLEEGEEKGLQKGRQEGLQEGLQKGMQVGRQEGLQEGRQEGLQEGLVTARETLLSLGEQRFGPPDSATRVAVESIDDLDRLKRSLLRLLSAKGWEELLIES
jgi:predicted transposase YdaD